MSIRSEKEFPIKAKAFSLGGKPPLIVRIRAYLGEICTAFEAELFDTVRSEV